MKRTYYNIEEEKNYEFAKQTRLMVDTLIREGIVNDETIPWGGMLPTKRNNEYAFNNFMRDCTKKKNWFEYSEDLTLTVDDMVNAIKSIKNKKWQIYCFSKLLKTRVAFSDENLLDSCGFTHNPNKYDPIWDNMVCGVKFDIKSTYLTNEFPSIESIENNVNEYLEKMYSGCTSINDGSERGHIGELNNRLFIINNSKEKKANRFMVEGGCNRRFEILKKEFNNFSDKYVFTYDAPNNNDGKRYSVKCAILYISQNKGSDFESKFLKNPN